MIGRDFSEQDRLLVAQLLGSPTWNRIVNHVRHNMRSPLSTKDAEGRALDMSFEMGILECLKILETIGSPPPSTTSPQPKKLER